MIPTAANCAKPRPDPDLPPAATPEGESVHIAREELQAFVHELRNHLNALMMNAGVVAASCKDRARMERFIGRLEQEGDRCAEMLQAFTDRHL